MHQPDGNVSTHYDDAYFAWQKQGGEFGAFANSHLFRDFIRPTDVVVDFGCGGGFLLDALICHEKFGVEINPAARSIAQQKFSAVSELTELPNEFADVVISNHALEHTYDPYVKLKQVWQILKPSGLAVFVVPCERYDTAYYESNQDQHLYTWSPINLGNLFRHAGFSIESCERIIHRWPPKPFLLQRLIGWRLFYLASVGYSLLNPKLAQVRVVARKPPNIEGRQ